MKLIRSFGISIGLSLVGFSYVLLALGLEAGFITLVLAAIELSFSFDNAIINAKVLTRLSPLWRTLFLSVGILIAIFGVRALLPLVIVGLTADLPLGAVADLAVHNPVKYAEELVKARPAISAFGGAFLLMLSLHFFTTERRVKWLKPVEKALSRYEAWWLPLVTSVVLLVIVAWLPANQHPEVALIAGLVGVGAYEVIHGGIQLLDWKFSGARASGQAVGWAAFATFLYLEVLDASLSFDGVIGAFAITSSVVLIAIGLGIGAVWVRSLTVFMVRNNTLEDYKYLEHGAHYAIAVLAVSMLLAVVVEVPDFVTGVACLALIAAAVITSRRAQHAAARHG